MEIKCSRRAFLSKGGFTLIELLVVVLIIGILAAVAVPQYKKAVYKAYGAEALAAADALDKALTTYYLEHGTYEGVSADTLNVQLPELKHFRYNTGCIYADGSSTFKNGCFSNAGFTVCLTAPSGTTAYMSWDKGKFDKGKSSFRGFGGLSPDVYFHCRWENRMGENFCYPW